MSVPPAVHVPPAVLKSLITTCSRYSDMDEESMLLVAREFIGAHERAPGRLSIEFGTRNGGSALLFLELLQEIYGEPVSMLFTVDPYGHKPYKGGDCSGATLYGDREHARMKQLLSLRANHAHFYLTSTDFLSRLAGCPYWFRGEERKVEWITFAFLDGDHDADTVAVDLMLLRPLMHPQGVIVIDNVDKDPAMKSMLSARGIEVHGVQAVMRGFL